MGQGAYIFGCESTRLSPDEYRFFTDAQPFGFILFARNVQDRAQLAALTQELRDNVGRNAPVFIDQEGGRVDRLTALAGPGWLPALDQVSAAPDQAVRSMWLRSRLIAADLLKLGIDANCTPLCDLANAGTHPVLKNRCYGSDPIAVAKIARSVADGLLAGGVLPVVKHMPGQGRALADSHTELPMVDAPLDDLRKTDFAPFHALADLPMGMSTHVVFSAVDDKPVTQSPRMIDLIRKDIGFDGLLMSDDIDMDALSGTVADRARIAIGAGCDIVLHCNGELAEMERLADAVGNMTPQAQNRADAAMNWRRPPDGADVDALQAELSEILTGAGHV